MAMRVCPVPGCPVLVKQGRCADHRLDTYAVRGTDRERGYGGPHKTARKRALASYHPDDPCPRCGHPLGDNPAALDLDHTDDRTGYLGLSHRRCNRSAAGQAAHG